jgi:choline-glycine betaine transporter
MTIIVAAPFVLVMIGTCVSLYKDVTNDPFIVKNPKAPPKVKAGK